MALKARKVALTPAAIDTLKSARIWDLLTPGLAIEGLATGKKCRVYHLKIAGKDILATLFGGLFPALSIADAREWARP